MYTINEVVQGICGFADHPEAWGEFRRRLLESESVILPGIGWAYMMEDTVGEPDSYGDYYGDVHFVFRVSDCGIDQHFRKWGEYDSYDSEPTYEGRLEEVQPVTKHVSAWEVKQ